MRLTFDRGTLLFAEPPSGFDPATLAGVLWDERVASYRAQARLCYPLLGELRRRGVRVSEAPRPRVGPPTGVRPVPLRPYQLAALEAWRQNGRRGTIVLPTGSGKTRVALAAIAATKTSCLVLVPTRALMAQWVRALGEFWDGPIGRFGDRERTLGPVTVATFASAYRHMALLGDRFGLMVVDEAHHFGNGARDEVLEMAIAPLRLGLSATPPGDAEVGANLSRLLGPLVFELAVGDLAGGFLAPLDRVTWHLDLAPDERAEYEALRAVYLQAHRAFLGSRLDGTWKDFLRQGARTDEGRRGIAAWRRAARLLAFPRCKQAALATLLARHRQQRTLIFVSHNDTAYAIAREHLVMPLTSDIGPSEREDVLQRFRAGTLRALVSAQVLNEGLDVPDAEVGIVVAGRLGEREHVQRVGRILRPVPGKRALLYELVIRQSAEVGQARRRGERLALGSRPSP